MTIAIMLGSVGSSLDIVGAIMVAYGLIKMNSRQIAAGASTYCGYQPEVLWERCHQAADTKVGACFLGLGFLLNIAAWYASWLWPVVLSLPILTAVSLFIVVPILFGYVGAKRLSTFLAERYYKAAYKMVTKGS